VREVRRVRQPAQRQAMKQKQWSPSVRLRRRAEAGPTRKRPLLSNSIYAVTKMGQEELVLNTAWLRSLGGPALLQRVRPVSRFDPTPASPRSSWRLKKASAVIYEDGLQCATSRASTTSSSDRAAAKKPSARAASSTSARRAHADQVDPEILGRCYQST